MFFFSLGTHRKIPICFFIRPSTTQPSLMRRGNAYITFMFPGTLNLRSTNCLTHACQAYTYQRLVRMHVRCKLVDVSFSASYSQVNRIYHHPASYQPSQPLLHHLVSYSPQKSTARKKTQHSTAHNGQPHHPPQVQLPLDCRSIPRLRHWYR